MRNNEKVDEYIKINDYLSDNSKLIISFIFFTVGVLAFVWACFHQVRHNWFIYALSGIGMIAFIFQSKERKKQKRRILELKGELKKWVKQ